MKVLQINSVCGYGSTGRIVIDIYKALEEQGHECKIAYGRGSAPAEFNTIKIGSKFDNYMHVAVTRLFDKHGFASKRATKIFLKKVREYNPDVIHLHNIHGYYINVEILFQFLKEINKPVIWTLHDCWAFTGHCAYFDFAQCKKWKTQCNACSEEASYPKSFYKYNCPKNYKKKKKAFTGVNNMTIVTPSRWLGNLIKESFLKESPVKVIHNGIDIDIFKPTASNFRHKHNLENCFIILGVANIWGRRKGFEYFIQLSKLINNNDKIILVGLSDKQLKNLPPNIIGIKRTDSVGQLAEIYSSADVFVNPTLEDNYPTTILESLACETPVITFDTGGCAECVNNNCGRVVKNRNIDGIIQGIQDVKSSKIPRKDCRKLAQSFQLERAFDEYIELYKEVRCENFIFN